MMMRRDFWTFFELVTGEDGASETPTRVSRRMEMMATIMVLIDIFSLPGVASSSLE
jgi:hypothetical protein